MRRALMKGLVQAAFARAPRGARAYETLTRGVMGTGMSHITKLSRVWRSYPAVWREIAGLSLDGRRVWLHEAGCTPFSGLAAYRLSGMGPLATSLHERMWDRYIAPAVDAALDPAFDTGNADRAERVQGLRWVRTSRELFESLGGQHLVAPRAADSGLAAECADLCHTGGALEHMRPSEARAFLGEAFRVLRPGATLSVVVDHRDHLVHADPSIPFSAHLAFPEPAYRILFDHPLGYHNRKPPAWWTKELQASGFSVLAVRRLVLPSKAFVTDDRARAAEPGLSRSRLAPQHRGIDDLDLRTAAAHYICRRA